MYFKIVYYCTRMVLFGMLRKIKEKKREGATKIFIIKTNDSPKHEPVCMHACEQDIPDSSWKLSTDMHECCKVYASSSLFFFLQILILFPTFFFFHGHSKIPICIYSLRIPSMKHFSELYKDRCNLEYTLKT